ncbi:aminodeoxychorismate/anthranilate synthase component I [Acetobacter lambici]|uniref:Anthranilate synthase component I family protein n=1 Tax=Acetobacter lambici TaxID=1332824 RepID=A0ABT1F0X1_9PROT|nr:anthranilate synthase component I family protein [Acetobacter lambici]MCP1258631.1 anthranilate synthase component I family protein [Acetobacter lambici]NHO56889.1 aminodeoxychorismate/anthranilate synthase component I [Acetobacter lambici]
MAWVRALPWREPDTVLAMWGSAPWCVLLDSGGALDGRNRWQIFCHNPRHTLLVFANRVELDGVPQAFGAPEQILDSLRKIQQDYQGDAPEGDLPFCGGWVGFASYTFGMALQGIPSRQTGADEPVFAAAFYDHAYVWDRTTRRAALTGLERGALAPQTCDRAEARWHALPEQGVPLPPVQPLPLRASQMRAAYCQAVSAAQNYIAQGDIFQVNMTCQHVADLPASVCTPGLYRRLRRAAPAPFGAYLSCGEGFSILSCSPERFLQVDCNGHIATRPIKGTAPRGQTEAEDQHLAQNLARDDKERAENLMIVDLMRNDIGRVARIGSVSVPELWAVERFAHVHHLVSEVRGHLRQEHDVFDLLAATLPPGSVTGAPKHRAMEIIDELEATPRGAYCGTLFCIGVDGRMDSSVIIRSFVAHAGQLRMGTGGGITMLSDPQKEYEEMRLKLAPFAAFAEGV